MKKSFLSSTAVFVAMASFSQMSIQSGATLFIESGAKVTLQGDLTSASSIQGPGAIVMKGSALQTITMNGFVIPNLEIDNASNVTLSGSAAKIGTNLLFTNGKLLTSTQDLFIAPTATITGANSSRFIWTDGTGQVRKELTADISNYEIPVGENTSYRPVYLTTTGGAYSSANIGVRNVAGASPNKPPSIASLASTYWPVSKTGITGGTQTITGQYIDPADVTGTEANLAGYYFNGADWTSNAETHDNATNRVSAPLASLSGELMAMNKFLAVGSRAFLQGAYNATTGLMSDALRTGGNVIPVGDPYRTSPYNASFTHVANTNAEIAAGTVFNNQASVNDDIVDWVFLELRNNALPGNAILQTRSALVQRDGDIVDIDGVSPVTFNNVVNGNYTIAVRHRNHLGLATSPATPRTFSETKSIAFTSNLADLRSTTTAVFGTSGDAYTIVTHPGLGNVNLLWGGNVNGNVSSRYQGPSNDRAALLTDIGSELSTPSGYLRADLNMNKIARYQGPNNDRSFLLSNVLGNIELIVRNQSLPQ